MSTDRRPSYGELNQRRLSSLPKFEQGESRRDKIIKGLAGTVKELGGMYDEYRQQKHEDNLRNEAATIQQAVDDYIYTGNMNETVAGMMQEKGINPADVESGRIEPTEGGGFQEPQGLSGASRGDILNRKVNVMRNMDVSGIPGQSVYAGLSSRYANLSGEQRGYDDKIGAYQAKSDIDTEAGKERDLYNWTQEQERFPQKRQQKIDTATAVAQAEHEFKKKVQPDTLKMKEQEQDLINKKNLENIVATEEVKQALVDKYAKTETARKKQEVFDNIDMNMEVLEYMQTRYPEHVEQEKIASLLNDWLEKAFDKEGYFLKGKAQAMFNTGFGKYFEGFTKDGVLVPIDPDEAARKEPVSEIDPAAALLDSEVEDIVSLSRKKKQVKKPTRGTRMDGWIGAFSPSGH